LWNSNFNVVLRQSTQRLDVLVVGALLDVTSVGFYQVGKRIMTNIVRIGGPTRQVLSPEMPRLWSAQKHDRFWKLVRYISLLMFGVSLAISIPLAWKMSDLAVLLFGAEFQGAAPVMTILMFAAVIYLGGLALNPALLSMGLDRALVRTTMMATGVFAISFVPLLFVLGIEGVALAHVIFNIVWTTGCILAIRSYPAPR
jgi:O-antigen/teichoic acid export membrane protein